MEKRDIEILEMRYKLKQVKLIDSKDEFKINKNKITKSDKNKN